MPKRSYRRRTKINDLVDDALILVLSLLSLQELVPLRIVCHKWNTSIQTICRGKQSLKLFVGYTAVGDYLRRNLALMVIEPELRLNRNDDLVLNPNALISVCPDRRIDPAGSRFLVDLFPNIQKLYLGFDNIYADNLYHDKFNFGTLISEWQHQLTTLLLSGSPRMVLQPRL